MRIRIHNTVLPEKFRIRTDLDPDDPSNLKSGSGIRILEEHPGSYVRELTNIFWVKKILKFFDADPGSGIFLTLDPGSGMEQFGSGINIPDLLHCQKNVQKPICTRSGCLPNTVQTTCGVYWNRNRRNRNFFTSGTGSVKNRVGSTTLVQTTCGVYRKRKRRSRWESEADKLVIPGIPTTLPAGLNKEQEEAYLCKYINLNPWMKEVLDNTLREGAYLRCPV